MPYDDPETVTLDQVREALKVLGISPDVKHVRSIHIAPGELTITRMQTTAGGTHFLVPGTKAIATETTSIRVVGA